MPKICYYITLGLMILSSYIIAQPQKTMSAADIELALKKLNTVGSVLYIAAHPDDENTRLLGYLANEKCLRTAYLSMNRGDGGQNLVGTEQGELLGLIRTQELLAARRVDGAEQFFTRANDFGYSKNPEETMRIWGHDSILADVVWIIRLFKPDVIITRFPTTGEGGHGHHTSSAILAGEAFTAAADPTKFKEQLKYVDVWQAKSLYWNTFNFGGAPNTIDTNQLKVDVGVYNPLLGKGYGELAAESRSMHKSQGFGVAKQRGKSLEYFKFIKGDSSATNLFAGIDQTWKRVDGSDKIASLLDQAYKEFSMEKPDKSLPVLIKAYNLMKSMKDGYWKTQKLKEFTDVILACGGVWMEADASDYSVVPGQQLKITANIINRSDAQFKLEKINYAGEKSLSIDSAMTKNHLFSITDSFNISAKTNYSTPYWLEKKHSIGIYNVTDQNLIGRPENPAPENVTFKLSCGDLKLEITRPV